jgi:hypothetical protein
VAGSCKHGDEPLGSGATELIVTPSKKPNIPRQHHNIFLSSLNLIMNVTTASFCCCQIHKYSNNSKMTSDLSHIMTLSKIWVL